MDRHHLLSLLDKIQEKYEIQDGEYKEFAEAIGGKKEPVDIDNATMIKVEYDKIEIEVDYADDDVFPKLVINEKCSTIWNIIENENNYHASEYMTPTYLLRCDIHRSVAEKFSKYLSEERFITFTLDKYQKKYCIRISKIEVIN